MANKLKKLDGIGCSFYRGLELFSNETIYDTDDVKKLICVLQKLVDLGNSVLLIEHNLDVIKVADYIIDLGPDGGDKGGNIVGIGTPEQLVGNEKSYTGQYLKRIFEK